MPFTTLCRGGAWRQECSRWWMRPDAEDRGVAERWYLPHSLGAEWREVCVPHCWEREGISKRFEGPVWYVTEAQIPADWQRGRVWLLLEGVSYAARVWVNGKEMGTHVGMWDRFACDITHHLNGGKAFIALRVVKPGGETYPVPSTLSGFLPYVWGTFGGIWQPAWLIRTPEAWMEDLYPNVVGKGHVEVEVSCGGQLPAQLRFSLYRPDGQEVDSREVCCDERAYVRVTLDDPKPQWWSPQSPHLYRLEVEITDLHGDTCRVSQPFGMRTVQVRSDTILLNGEPVYPRGVLHWGWYPQHLAPFPTEDEIRAELQALREMGFNLVKFCLWVPPCRYLHLCDQMGMLGWMELPMWLPEVTSAFQRQTLEEYRRIVLQLRGHASLLLWTLGCELSESASAPFLEKLYWLVKRLTDSPLVRDNSGGGEAYHGLLREYADFYDNHFYCDPPFLRPLMDYFAPRGRESQPWLFGEYCDVDTLRDVPALLEAHGGAPPWWAQEDEEVNPQGVRPNVYASQQVQRFSQRGLEAHRSALLYSSLQQGLLHRKVTIETTRLYREVSGYVVTSITDTPIATSGLWDDLGELKWRPEEWRRFNNDSVLLLQFHRRREWTRGGDRPAYVDWWNFWGGQTLYAHVSLSHYGRTEHRGRLHWQLLDEAGDVRQNGECETEEPFRSGTLSPVATFELNLSEVSRMEPLTLRCELQLGAEGIQNEWELWCYPPVDAHALGKWAVYDPQYRLHGAEKTGWQPRHVSEEQLASERRIIASAWHPRLLQALRQGARVVLFQQQHDGLPAEGMPFWREATRLFLPHPLWQWFRHKGYTGTQFLGLTCDCALVPERMGEALGDDAQVQPVLRRVDTRSLAVHDYLVDITMGEGRMLATTLRLAEGLGSAPSGIAQNVAGLWLL
ncbi:MAG: glycoside hydrolase family 2 TIM barrel-domain containing protein, partial [Armatimonadota bacterium]|nr:glycoside hydrolase family 2 TIM barrel-domain containing protein [Armatimonadota bacterium]